MQDKEKTVAEILLKAIEDASDKAEAPNECTPRSRAISDYREFIMAASQRSNIGK